MAKFDLLATSLGFIWILFSVQTSAESATSETGSWNVTETNVTCILFQARISLSVNYSDVYNETKVTEIEIPVTAEASGSCGGPKSSQQSIILTWLQPNATIPHGLNSTLTLEFHANQTSQNGSAANAVEIPLGKYALSKVSAIVHKDSSLFPNATNPTVPFILNADNLLLFPTTLGHSHACQSEMSLEGSTKPEQRAQFKLMLLHSQIQAFRSGKEGNTGEFGAAEHCSADEIMSGSVLATVGIVILIIVLVSLGAVLLATFYLRRKKRLSDPYETL